MKNKPCPECGCVHKVRVYATSVVYRTKSMSLVCAKCGYVLNRQSQDASPHHKPYAEPKRPTAHVPRAARRIRQNGGVSDG
jgi:transcription initiation factor TFIIIB Brf1 subunit/transcription initiation factor TFIIB